MMGVGQPGAWDLLSAPSRNRAGRPARPPMCSSAEASIHCRCMAARDRVPSAAVRATDMRPSVEAVLVVVHAPSIGRGEDNPGHSVPTLGLGPRHANAVCKLPRGSVAARRARRLDESLEERSWTRRVASATKVGLVQLRARVEDDQGAVAPRGHRVGATGADGDGGDVRKMTTVATRGA